VDDGRVRLVRPEINLIAYRFVNFGIHGFAAEPCYEAMDEYAELEIVTRSTGQRIVLVI